MTIESEIRFIYFIVISTLMSINLIVTLVTEYT